MIDAYVIAEGEATDHDDGEVAGVYLIEIKDEAPARFREEAALETFHLKIGIAVLDDFTIWVVDGNGRPFEDQEAGSNVRDEQPLESWAEFAGRLEGDDVPAGVRALLGADSPAPPK